jgi:CarboxypepD_reg-like domain
MTDVHKYLKGELSAGEMHALEKAALDDPFLADALEGLATREVPAQHLADDNPAPISVLDQDLSDLRSRLEDSVAEKRSRIFILPRIRIAAAVILLAGLGLIALYTSTSKQKANTVSAAHVPPPAADVATAPVAKAAAQSVSKPAAAPKASTHLRRQESLAVSPTPQAEFRSMADSIVVPVVPIKKDSFDYNPDLAANSNHALQTKPLLFSGQVLDTRNRPLAGVSLFLEGKRSGTVTDGEGYFKLYVPPRDTVRKLRVDYVGYDQTSIVLNSENRLSNVITLKEHESALNEVVVTGLGMKRKETMAEAPSEDQKKPDSLWTSASPAIGRAAYLDYLAAGKKSLGADSSIQGTVSISFDINQKGQLSNYKIEQSLSPVQDAGTIRLISEGPSWKLIHGKKARLLVSLAFP